jgi:diguanylate cyclase (GGDEF)-like protein
MNRHPMQLDEPSAVSRGAAVAGIGLSVVFLLGALVVARLPRDPVIEMPSVVLAHSLSMAIVGIVTAILLYAHATRSQNPGYLVLAGTFVTAVILVAALPLAFPGGLTISDEGPPERLAGGLQSSISLFYGWHLVLYLGLPVSALALLWATTRPRRPLRRWTIGGSIAIAVLLGLSGAAWALLAPDSLPVFIGPDGITALAATMDWVLLGIAIVGLLVIVAVTRERNAISRWITAAAVLSLGEAIVNVGVERYSIGWYFTRTFGLLATSSLLVALVWEMARVDRTTLTVASRDGLTNTRSRASFEKDLDREVARCRDAGQRLALLWIDVDDFKGVNDRFGHQAGDEVLRVLANRATTQIRSTDLLARMGGDEFAIAIPEVASRASAMTVAQRIVEQFAQPMEIDGQRVYSSCSIGVAFAPDDAEEAHDLSNRADVAMYEAKAMGGNRVVVFQSGLGEHAQANAELRLALMAGIEERAFLPYAQPVVDVESGRTVGLEVLARWSRDGHVEAAASFLQSAEVARLLVPIGRQVLGAAIEILPDLLAHDRDLGFVTVNLSVNELRDEVTVAMLSSPPWLPLAPRVILEVTESDAIDNEGPAFTSLTLLRDLGYRLAVDDFGSGYSTITRLEQLQPSLIKADRSLLVRTQQPGPHPEAMLRWAFDISQALGSQLVVEGVETEGEEAVVRALGPVLAQGYRYGRPAPLESWLVEPRHLGLLGD